MRLVLSPFARVTLRIEVAIETDNTETPPTNLRRVTLRRQTFGLRLIWQTWDCDRDF